MFILLENELWNLLLGFIISVINYMDFFFLWNLLYIVMVFFLDFSSKCDIFDILCFMDDFYYELFY